MAFSGSCGTSRKETVENHKYSLPIPGSKQEGYSAVYRFPSSLENDDLVCAYPNPCVVSYWSGFLVSCKEHGDRPCLGTRITNPNGSKGCYKWISYNETRQKAIDFGSGLKHLSLCQTREYDDVCLPNKSYAFLGIKSRNRAEWIVSDLAASAFGIAVVTLFDTLEAQATEFITTQTLMDAMCSEGECVTALLQHAESMQSLKTIICYDEITAEQSALACEKSVKLYTFEEVMKEGKEHPSTPVEQSYESLSNICYTSGTTGDPKGVMLLNKNIISAIASAVKSDSFFDAYPTDVHISYLPLAHVYERLAEVYLLFNGSSIGFYSGSTITLLEDIQELKPTVFLSVPRLYTRILDKVLAGVSAKNFLAQWLFNMGMKTKLTNFRNDGTVTHSFYDAVVFSKISALLGGRVRVMVTGSAPLAAEVQEKISCLFNCILLEGWGMTETCAITCIQTPTEFRKGFVGGITPGFEIKLRSVPEMEYDAENGNPPKGELCIRGPACFVGYFCNPEETAKTICPDGWISTGDITTFEHNGGLKIIDRKKNIYKLAQGEYVAPEKLEGIYSRAPLVAQIFVHGYSTKSVLVAIVVPDIDMALIWASKHSKKATTLEELVKDAELKAQILKEMEAAAGNQLCGFEKVKNIHLSSELFCIENHLLNATFKIVRHNAIKAYEAQIDQLYAEYEKTTQRK